MGATQKIPKKKAVRREAACFLGTDGTPGMIRTCDPLIRSQVLYPAELRVHKRRTDRLPTLAFRVKNTRRELPSEVAGSRACDQRRILDLDPNGAPLSVALYIFGLIIDRI